MTGKPCIIFDIDGTVADLTHRRHLVTGHPKNWPEFFRLITKDKPIKQTIYLNRFLYRESGMPVFMASGRSEKERRDTENWLADNRVEYDRLFMRPADDYRKDTIIKEEILAQIREEGYEPWLIFDDRECVTEMWRKNGLFVLQCDPNPAEVNHDDYQFHDGIKFPLTIMVGPSGAGKSSYVTTQLATGVWSSDMVISSDALRQQITGDFRNQDKNLKVFETMYELAKNRLRLGLPVVLDATHLKNAERIKAALLVPECVPVQYVVIDRPLKEKHATAGWRADVTVGKSGRSLIDQHAQTFKSNRGAILNGDSLPNVTVKDLTR